MGESIRLPTENEIARQFNVGRQTVREALRLLELSGFITIERGGRGGPVVTNNTLTSLSNSLTFAIEMNDITIEDLTKARLEIEKIVIHYAVRNAAESDIEALKANIASGQDKIAQGLIAKTENINFHVLPSRCSKNNVFVVAVASIMTVMAGFLNQIPQSLLASELTLKEHEKILEAVILKDEVLAEERMWSHIQNINNRFNDSFKQVVGGSSLEATNRLQKRRNDKKSS